LLAPDDCNGYLPWAIRIFKCDKAWRFWNEVEEGVHYTSYRFADRAACDAALATPDFKEMIADFNRAWPEGVARTRDFVTLVEERGGVVTPASLGLMVRSAAKPRVSNHGAAPSFETPAARALQDEAETLIALATNTPRA
jgi:hypothetical protein